MINKLLLVFLFSLSTIGLYSQNVYSKDEVDIKLELQQERISSKLDAIERENKAIDVKIAAQDKQLDHQDKQLENLKFVFSILLSIIGIAVAIGAFFIDKRNKERFADLQEELKGAKDDALQELNRIRDIANLEIKMAQTELNQIKAEIKKTQSEK